MFTYASDTYRPLMV